MMTLKDCKVTFEPKDEPSHLLRFWVADVYFEKDIFSAKNFSVNEHGEFVVNIELRAKIDPTKPDSCAFGFLGDYPL